MPVWKSISKDHKVDQPSPTQFGYGLAERISEFDKRHVEFDALRGELVIDDADRVDISELYNDFMAQQRHQRFPVLSRYLVKWREQMPVVDTTEKDEAVALKRHEAFKLEVKRAKRRVEKRLNKG